MTVLTFNFYSHEPTASEFAPNPEFLPIGSFAYHKGQWAHVANVPAMNRFVAGHKIWLPLPEHQVPQTIRLKALLLT